MKKGYYIFVENCGSSGVKKKISMQYSTFSKYFEIELLQIKSVNYGFFRRAYNMLPWASFGRCYLEAIESMQHPDFVYVRRAFVDRDYILFFYKIREKWPECKIIVELPIFPYDQDMKNNIYTRFMYVKELLFRKYYKTIVDRFVTYSDDDVIFDVKTIRTMNGVNVEEINPIIHNIDRKVGPIHLLAVAMLLPHHGYERIIKGIHAYYASGGKREIVFDIVGDGTEKAMYCDLVEQLGLQSSVHFWGEKYGDELDYIYSFADIGIAAFGAYKEGIEKLCTIKVREYLAKGIPVALGGHDDVFDGEMARYGIEFSNDNSIVDIKKMIDFLDKLHAGKERLALVQEIRKASKSTIDNSVTLRPVIDYINEE